MVQAISSDGGCEDHMSFSLEQQNPATKPFISFKHSLGMWRENERREREGIEVEWGCEKRGGINTLFSGEALFGLLARMRTHTNKQVTHTHVYLSF